MKWQVSFGKKDSKGFQEVIDPNAQDSTKHTGIYLMPADGYKLEDYEINISNDNSSKNNIDCQDIYIKLLSKPKDSSEVIIDSQTNIAFEDGLILAVKGPITLGRCENVKIKSHDTNRVVTLKGGLLLEDILDSTIRFEKPREEIKKEIANGLVSFNKVRRLDISIPENVKKVEIKNNFNGATAIPKGVSLNRVELSAFEIVTDSCIYSFKTQYSSLDISADIVKCEGALFNSEYNGAIKVKSVKKEEHTKFKVEGADFNFYGNGILNAYTPTLIFEKLKKKNGPSIPIKITNGAILVSPLIFFCYDALTLTDSTVTCKDGVNFGKTIIENSTLELASTPGKENSFIVAEIHNSSIKNLTGDLRGILNDVSINNLTMGDNTSIKVEPPERVFDDKVRTSYAFCNISGVEIKDNSSLNISANSNKFLDKEYNFSPIKISNTVVEGGSNYIYRDTLVEINNSVLKNAQVSIINSYQYTTILSNSVFAGDVELVHAKEIAFSEIVTSKITGDRSNPFILKNQSIKNQNISDWNDYLKNAKTQEPNPLLLTTKDIEIL